MSAKKKINKKETKKVPQKSRIFSNEEFKYLSIIVLAGFILRFLYVIETQGSPFFQNLFSDSGIYYDLALKIMGGNWIGSQVFFMSPGYPYFLAVIFTILGKSILAVRLIQIFLNSINIILIYLTTRSLHSEKAGYASAIIAAIFSPFIFYSGAILLEVVQTFILSVFLLIISNRSLLKENRNWLWAGITLGIAGFFRANILLLFPVMFAWFLFKAVRNKDERKLFYRGLLYFSAGCLVPVFLVTARNYIAGGDFVVISSNGGINFYLGNNENAPGIYKTPEDFDFFKDLSGRKYAEQISGDSLSPSEASAFWVHKSLDYIEKNPADWLSLTGKKILLFFDDNDNPQSAIMDPSFFAENYSTILSLPLPGFFIVFIISIFGLILTFNRRKEYTLVYLFIITYIAATVLFFITGRFRVAVSPAFITFAGIGIIEGYSLARSKLYRKLIVPASAAVLITATVMTLIPRYNFSNYDAYIDLGNSFFEKHKYDEALLNFKKAVSLKADANSFVLLGNTYAAKSEFKPALDSYYKAINNQPDYYLAWFNMGIAYTQMRNLDQAEQAFTKTIKLKPDFADAYRNLAIIDYIKEDYKSSLFNFEKFLSLTDDKQAKKTVQQDIQELKRRINSK